MIYTYSTLLLCKHDDETSGAADGSCCAKVPPQYGCYWSRLAHQMKRACNTAQDLLVHAMSAFNRLTHMLLQANPLNYNIFNNFSWVCLKVPTQPAWPTIVAGHVLTDLAKKRGSRSYRGLGLLLECVYSRVLSMRFN